MGPGLSKVQGRRETGGCAGLEAQDRGVGGNKQLPDGALPWVEGGGVPQKKWGGCKAALKKGSSIRVLRLGPPSHQGGPEVSPKEGTVVE